MTAEELREALADREATITDLVGALDFMRERFEEIAARLAELETLLGSGAKRH